MQHLAKICAEEGIPLILDPAPAKEIPASIFEQVQWFTPNETEAAFYAHTAPQTWPGEIAALLLQQGATGIILKMGSQGAYLATSNGIKEQVSAFPVATVDTTAAGDVFNGAFAMGLMLGKSPVDSARFASAAAALSVTKPGAQSQCPTGTKWNNCLAPRGNRVQSRYPAVHSIFREVNVNG